MISHISTPRSNLVRYLQPDLINSLNLPIIKLIKINKGVYGKKNKWIAHFSKKRWGSQIMNVCDQAVDARMFGAFPYTKLGNNNEAVPSPSKSISYFVGLLFLSWQVFPTGVAIGRQGSATGIGILRVNAWKHVDRAWHTRQGCCTVSIQLPCVWSVACWIGLPMAWVYVHCMSIEV